MVELLGFQTGGLIIPFDNDTKKPFGLSATGIKFDRVFDGNVHCQYRGAGGAAQADKRIQLPTAAQLVAWLAKSKSPEAHSAAIDALQRAGVDATSVKVAKAEIEWQNDRALQDDLWGKARTRLSFERGKAWHEGEYLNWAIWYFAPLTWANQRFDFIRSDFIWTLGWLADYGYRPYKIVLYVIGFIILSRILISWSLLLGIKKAESEKGAKFKVGWFFIIDHMIPSININDDHAKVKDYFDKHGASISPQRKLMMSHTIRIIKFVSAVAALFVAASLKAVIVG